MAEKGIIPPKETKKTEAVKTEKEKAEDEEKEVTIESFKTTATIEETVLYDENNVKITATGLNYTDYVAELNVMIENNGDKDLSFICNSVGYNCNAINGYMVDDGYLSADVAAGKKANETISFSITMTTKRIHL